MDFSIERFLELRDESRKLLQQGKRIGNSKIQNELQKYSILFKDDIFYQNMEHYLTILESFTQNDITVQEFIDRFTKLRTQDVQAVHDLKDSFRFGSPSAPNLKALDLEKNFRSGSTRAPDPKASGFEYIVSDINSLIILFDSSLDNPSEPQPSYRISEKELKEYLQEDISLIRQYLEKS